MGGDRESAHLFTLASEGNGGRFDDWILVCASCEMEFVIGQGGVQNAHVLRLAREHRC